VYLPNKESKEFRGFYWRNIYLPMGNTNNHIEVGTFLSMLILKWGSYIVCSKMVPGYLQGENLAA
jgi:hypothetical protein